MELQMLVAFKHAFIAGLAVAVACSLLSPFVVLKRFAFIGQGVSHAGFGGIGLAIFAGLWWPQMLVDPWRDVLVAAFCVAAALLIGRIVESAWADADSAIGVTLALAMAIGVACMDLYGWLRPEAYRPDLHGLLFGDIFSATATAAAGSWMVAALVGAFVAGLYKELVFYSFDEEGALVFGTPVRFLRYSFLVLIAITVVTAMRLVGVILVTALLVIPGLIGRCVSQRMGCVIWGSVLFGTAGMIIGLLLTVWLEVLSSGAVIAVVLGLELLSAVGLRKIAGTLNRVNTARLSN